MDKLVSIIIPTFNRASILRETLDSVLEQTYTNWECLVIDDGSKDETEEVVNAYTAKDDRIKFYQRPSGRVKGASACRNYGLEISKGSYIQFLDSDDLLSNNKIEEQLELLEKDPDCSLATCKWGTFKTDVADAELHENLAAYQNFDNPLHFIEAMGVSICYFPPHAYLIKKSVIFKAGFWNEHLSLNDDSEFMIRVFINSGKICFSEKSIAYYRLAGNDNLRSFNSERKVLDAIYSWKLIENNLKIRFKQENFQFMERAKKDFYEHARIFPDLLAEHKVFFKSQMKPNTNLYKRLFGKN